MYQDLCLTTISVSPVNRLVKLVRLPLPPVRNVRRAIIYQERNAFNVMNRANLVKTRLLTARHAPLGNF